MLFLSSVALAGGHAHKQSQDVAAAARQARARKQERKTAKTHVYTNEDLSRAKILTPEDAARLEAKKNDCAKKNNCTPTEKSRESLDASSQKPGTSLGEVARQYRKQKETQKQLDALKPEQSEPFHLPSSEPTLASPVLPGRPTMRQPVAPPIRPGTNAHVMRRDPFARVPMHLARPAVPEVRADLRNEISRGAKPATPNFIGSDFFADVRPTFVQRAHRKFPRAPKFSSSFSSPLIPVQPSAPVVIPSETFPTAPVDTAPLRSFAPRQSAAEPAPVAPRKSLTPAETVRPSQPRRILPTTPSISQRTINVKRGDSLWKVAQENLGSGSRWPELLAANPWIANRDRIRIGIQLALPVAAAMRASAAAGKGSSSTIKVHKGDTLWSLAKVNLGRWSAWPCLAAANLAVSDPNRIFEGQELVLPAACRDSNRGSLRSDEK
ncbi:MAG TPA: LysM peptidoglycan-binding domain-containing protein [Candidatus Methylomirabilis sp.]|nr:LysM peptidoglycan-binding domain-containing protein [Candidatus Methylomirabilis sp.]